MSSLSDLRRQGSDKKPPHRGDRLAKALETQFPGSEWVESPYQECGRQERASNGPPSASTSSEGSTPRKSSDALLLKRGTGGYAVVVGSTYDAKSIRDWASTLPAGTHILCGSPRFSKNGVPQNGEAVLVDATKAEELPWGEDFLGPKYRELQSGLLVNQAVVEDMTLVLIGTGKKIDTARKALAIYGEYAPTVLEL